MIFPWQYIDPDIITRSSNSTNSFPKIWEIKQPTVDKYVLQKLNELEQEVKELKEELEKLKDYGKTRQRTTTERPLR